MDVRVEAKLRELLDLLPPGQAIRTDEASNVVGVLRVSAIVLAALEARAEGLLDEADPRTATAFLSDWERLLALPDCGELAGSTEGRRQDVVEKLTREGSMSANSLVAAAAAVGFNISIEVHRPFPPSSDGSPLADAHVFDVTVAGLEIEFFRVGGSRVGDSLGAFGDDRLVCLLEQRKPAHTQFRLINP